MLVRGDSMSLRGIRSRLRQSQGGGGCDSDQGSPSRSASFFQQLAAFLGPDEPTSSSKSSYSHEVFSLFFVDIINICVCFVFIFPIVSLSLCKAQRLSLAFSDRYPGVAVPVLSV